MDKYTRNAIESATQRARRLLEEDFAAQLEGEFDAHLSGVLPANAGRHLSPWQMFQRERILAAIEHKRGAGMNPLDAVSDYLRDAAFTTLNRFVALKMLEARDLVQDCISRGEESAGYREFYGMAPGLALLPNGVGYRLYVESLFDELSTEVKVLFDRRDPSSALWPRRATFDQLLEILNAPELSEVWAEDETIGWVYQFFNGQDERRKMRDESSAPRNSRELAVRNQFFTPRYIVQFLTDNTLGRIWYEMRGRRTALAEKCQHMAREAEEDFVPREKRDPRDLRILDPACGSGHFLLYAFDLLLAIYEEAYADRESPKSGATGKTLAEDYPSLEALRKAIPGLVLAHNLHGVDIDARCVQIAQLALWMRAQKAYRDFGIRRAERAQIRQSSIIVAEPLVADDQVAKEFIAKLRDAELQRVFTRIVESLKPAGELGLLLRVDEVLESGEGTDLFAPQQQRVHDALLRFIDEQRSLGSMRRRLFAEDAAYGVGLLSIARTKFDVVLMNPPFGDPTRRGLEYLAKHRPLAKHELLTAFVEAGAELLVEQGRLGAITKREPLFTTTFEEWRKSTLFEHSQIHLLLDAGGGVLDGAMVEVAAYVIQKGKSTGVRLLAARRAEAFSLGGEPTDLWDVPLEEIMAFPGCPLAYDASEFVRSTFKKFRPLGASWGRTAQGLGTTDDFRFCRLWWEVPTKALGHYSRSIGLGEQPQRWVPYVKGEPATLLWGDVPLVVNWGEDGKEVKAYNEQRYGSASRNVKSEALYGTEGIVFSRRTKRFSPRLLPKSCIFSVGGQAVFASRSYTLRLLGLLASSTADELIRPLLGRADFDPQFEVGAVARIPLPPSEQVSSSLAVTVEELIRALQTASSSNEFCRYYSHPAIPFSASSVDSAVAARRDQRALCELEVHRLWEDLNTQVAQAYGPREPHEPEAMPANLLGSAEPSVTDVLHLGLGIAFGRYSIETLTVTELPARILSELPVKPRAVLDGAPEGRTVLVDDEGHEHDIVRQIKRGVNDAWHEPGLFDQCVRAVATPEGVRQWFRDVMFALHIERSTLLRRKAPIYWQLSTPSASYSVWLYIHAFSKDTLFRVQNDYVAPKLAHEVRRLEALTGEAHDGAVPQRKKVALQEVLVEELRAFLDEVKRVAPLWNPNLDDGVIVNFAPLWRLVPQNKSLQKELNAAWDALCEGTYDWAHLAMRLWPERVVPKCAKDRSLAIAHGLENVFWVEGKAGKWTERKTPTRAIDDLVREHTSAAVKAALKSLLEAPSPTNATRSRRGRRHSVSVDARGG